MDDIGFLSSLIVVCHTLSLFAVWYVFLFVLKRNKSDELNKIKISETKINHSTHEHMVKTLDMPIHYNINSEKNVSPSSLTTVEPGVFERKIDRDKELKGERVNLFERPNRKLRRGTVTKV